MKKTILIILAFITVSCKSHSQDSTEELNVLFIGNSLTFYHDMPQMVQKMLNETNPNIKIHQSTFPLKLLKLKKNYLKKSGILLSYKKGQ